MGISGGADANGFVNGTVLPALDELGACKGEGEGSCKGEREEALRVGVGDEDAQEREEGGTSGWAQEGGCRRGRGRRVSVHERVRA